MVDRMCVLTIWVEFELDGRYGDVGDRRKSNLAIMHKVCVVNLTDIFIPAKTEFSYRWSSPSLSSITSPSLWLKPPSYSNTCDSSLSSVLLHILATYSSL
jgi:hypothetical protein